MGRPFVIQLVQHARIGVPRLIEDRPQQFRQIQLRYRLGGPRIPPEGQGRGNHRLQLFKIREDLAALFVVLDELGPQLQPGDRRAQIVPDRGQQLRAVLHEAADAGGHGVEGDGGDGDLGRDRSPAAAAR